MKFIRMQPFATVYYNIILAEMVNHATMFTSLQAIYPLHHITI